MDEAALAEFLRKYNLLSSPESEEPDQRYWPGDKS
jgi:hypothetical protein